MAADTLPKEVGRGVIRIGPVEVEVIQLDDGRRLISPEGLAAVLQWLGHDSGPIAGVFEDREDGV